MPVLDYRVARQKRSGIGFERLGACLEESLGVSLLAGLDSRYVTLAGSEHVGETLAAQLAESPPLPDVVGRSRSVASYAWRHIGDVILDETDRPRGGHTYFGLRLWSADKTKRLTAGFVAHNLCRMNEIQNTPLRAKRLEMKLKLSELAKDVGISKASLSKIERDQQKPRLSTVRELVRVTGLRPELIDPRMEGLTSEAAFSPSEAAE